MPTSDEPHINGVPPDLRGKRCDTVICQQYWHDGELVEPANVVFLQFDGAWHRLYFDYPIVFWRQHDGPPEPSEAPELDSAYPLVDLAQKYSLKGTHLREWKAALILGGSQVTFEFANGRKLVFRSVADVTSYAVE